MGDNLDLLRFFRLREFDGGRQHLDAGDPVFGGVTIGDTLGDPVKDGLVIRGAWFETQPATVGDLLGWLGEHEALPWVRAIEAATAEVVEEGLVVEFRVIAAEREFETVLAFSRAVTGTGGAADLV